MTSKWEEAMWAELEQMSPQDQVVATGEWITMMTQQLLPALARHRRLTVVAILESDDWDATKLAETIGSRPGTIQRLAEEGRAALRQSA